MVVEMVYYINTEMVIKHFKGGRADGNSLETQELHHYFNIV